MNNYRISNGTLVSPYGYIDETIWTEGQLIKSISSKSDVEDYIDIDASNCYVTPGLIDIHTHGGLGCDFLFSTEEKIDVLKRDLLRQGVTMVLPTIMSAPIDVIHSSIEFLTNYIPNQADNLPEFYGINLEGPFISKKFRGMHGEKFIQDLSLRSLKNLINSSIKIITIAPELDETGEVIDYLGQQDIIVSCGHTAASYEQACFAFKKGAKLITHLFNAMSPIHHREPGIIASALTNDDVYIEIIADGIHVHKGSIEFAIRSKNFKNVVLISDSIPQRGCNSYISQIDEYNLSVQDDKTSNADGKIAGSVLPLDQSVRNMVDWGIVDFKTAIGFVTYNPARLLNINSFLGSLYPGYKNHLVLWDKESLGIRATIINGYIYNF